MRVLSVDLGTSNTAVVLAVADRPPRSVEVDGSATMSSAVFANEDGTLVVGTDAERRARLDPARFEPNPKRRIDEGTLLLGESVVPVTDALGAVFARVAEETSRQLAGAMPDEVRLTHPAQWGPVRRNVLLASARLGGFGGDLVLVPEPVAAAAHFASFPGQSLAPGQALAVYDLGAGTFDCAVVGATQQGFTVLAEGGLPDLGGLDVDQVLLEHVGREVSHRDPAAWQRLLRPESTTDRRAQRALREDVRSAKEALSRHPQTEVPMPEPFADVLVTRAELEALIRPSLLRSVELLTSTVGSTGIPATSLAGIYLVGGASRIPLVATLIAERLRVVPTSLDQPETAVAFGAHDVPREGISVRTQDLGNQLAHPVAALGPPSYPGTGPQQIGYQGYPNSGPMQVGGPNSGPMRVPGPMSGPMQMGGPSSGPVQTAPYPSYPQLQGGPGVAAKGGHRRHNLLVAGAVAVVVVLAVVGGIVWFSRGGTTVDASCTGGGSADSQGFVPCVRQLAGSVPDHAQCRSGLGSEDSAFSGLGSDTVTCQLGSGSNTYSVVYMKAASTAQRVVDQLVSGGGGNLVEAAWQGNGLTGRYQAGVDGSMGVLVFTVRNSPLLGVLTRVQFGNSHSLTPDSLADYFERNVQPGT